MFYLASRTEIEKGEKKEERNRRGGGGIVRNKVTGYDTTVVPSRTAVSVGEGDNLRV